MLDVIAHRYIDEALAHFHYQFAPVVLTNFQLLARTEVETLGTPAAVFEHLCFALVDVLQSMTVSNRNRMQKQNMNTDASGGLGLGSVRLLE